jgi:hypothetical protein
MHRIAHGFIVIDDRYEIFAAFHFHHLCPNDTSELNGAQLCWQTIYIYVGILTRSGSGALNEVLWMVSKFLGHFHQVDH